MMSEEKTRTAYRERAKKKCRHCKKRRVNRPRGLCYACHRDEAIRDLYPSMRVKTNNRGFAVGNVNLPSSPVRTTAPPGSPRKLREMSGRLKAGCAPHHPDDARDWSEATREDRQEFDAQFATGLGKRSTRADLERLHATPDPEHEPD